MSSGWDGRRVVVHTPDVVGERMAGPGIRAWHLALELARHFPTTLVAKTEGKPAANPEALAIVGHGTVAAGDAMRAAAVLIGQPARGFRRRAAGQRMVYDLFDPTVLELRELYGEAPSLRQRVHLAAEWGRLAHALLDADLLIAGSLAVTLAASALAGLVPARLARSINVAAAIKSE